MARGRMLQNRISRSHKLASLSSDTARLLYTWLLSHLDVNGNFYADPVMVNNLVFTRLGHTVKTVALILDELEEKGLIIRYSNNGETYLNYPDFEEKQPKLNRDREGRPDIPILTQEELKSNSGETQTQIKLSKDKLSKDNVTPDLPTPTPPIKTKFAEFVFLTEDELAKLRKKFGDKATKKMIEKLNTYKGAHGKKYKSDYMAILSWVVEEVVPNATVISEQREEQKFLCGNCHKEVKPGEQYCPECLSLRDNPKNQQISKIIQAIGKAI